WLDGFDRPPLSRWTYPSVGELRARMAQDNDGSQPAQPYQRGVGPRLRGLGPRPLRGGGVGAFRPGRAPGSRAPGGFARAGRGVVDPAGRRQLLRARYLVGCDGANSAVRSAAGIGVEEPFPGVWHCDVYFRSSDPGLHRHGRFFLANAAAGLTLVARDGERT